jgi:hypothetical protein
VKFTVSTWGAAEARRISAASASVVTTRICGGEISTSWPRTLDVASAAADIIWFMASPTALSSSSVSSAPSAVPRRLGAHGGASRRAPSTGSRKTLPPVTPST